MAVRSFGCGRAGDAGRRGARGRPAAHGVDERLADMLVLPASLANGMTVFQVDKISKHLETNLFVVSKITGCKYGIGKLRDGYEVRIEGISYSGIK